MNFSDLPKWQRRGSGLYWEAYEKTATNPKTGEPVAVARRRVVRDLELPMKDEYNAFVRALMG